MAKSPSPTSAHLKKNRWDFKKMRRQNKIAGDRYEVEEIEFAEGSRDRDK